MTTDTVMSQQCTHCGKKDEKVTFKQCASCKYVLYCSKLCQVNDWAVHREKCAPSHCMTMNSAPKREKQTKMVPLVGKKYLIDCYIQGKLVQALWDSGSQVTIIDEMWKEVHLPDMRLRDISEIVDTADKLDIVAANGENMPYAGWVEVTFKLAPENAPSL